MNAEGDPIYLDYNATTPIAPEVLEAMLPALRDAWGNPSSGHAQGRRARRALDAAREQVAALIGARADEVVFTSGGTEADNAAIVGVAEALAGRGRHVVISTIEHSAVDLPCAWLEGRGFRVTRVAPRADGAVEAAAVEAALEPDTVLLSIMHANNETGVLQPIRPLGALARARGVVFHTDAAQSVGKLAVSVDDLGVDLLTIAGHKLYAPKGVGALYVRRGTPLAPLLRGAGHERGLRSGTENTPAIAGLGAACELARRETGSRERHLARVRDRLEAALSRAVPDLVVHGARAERLPNTLSAAVPGIDANRLLSSLRGVATAAGAACHSGRSEPSRVLRAMGVPDELAVCTLRLTVGRPTTLEEADAAAAEIATCVAKLRREDA
jgi:cysteine desulfurase